MFSFFFFLNKIVFGCVFVLCVCVCVRKKMEDQLAIVRPGDASVAAPFTSRVPSVKSVIDLVRQGRCTMLSALQQQQIMMLECMIYAFTLAAMSLEGARTSERQMMVSGQLLTVCCVLFLLCVCCVIPLPSPSLSLSFLSTISYVAQVAAEGHSTWYNVLVSLNQ